jgi:predicted transcriptional regulator
MNTVRRTLELDSDTDARLQLLEAERGQDAARVVADAIALLASTVEIGELDIQEDLRRLHEFERTGQAIPGDDVKAWIESWGAPNELARPQARKVK